MKNENFSNFIFFLKNFAFFEKFDNFFDFCVLVIKLFLCRRFYIRISFIIPLLGSSDALRRVFGRIL